MKRHVSSWSNRARVKKQRFLKKFLLAPHSAIPGDVSDCDEGIFPDSSDKLRTNHDNNILRLGNNSDHTNNQSSTEDEETNQCDGFIVPSMDPDVYLDGGCQTLSHNQSNDHSNSSHSSQDSQGNDSDTASDDFRWFDPMVNHNDEEEQENPGGSGMRQKVYKWAVSNVGSVNLRVVTEMLQILRSEDHEDIPPTAQKLLGYAHSVRTVDLATKRGTVGQYFYLGIENELSNNVNPEIYKEEEIKVLAILMA